MTNNETLAKFLETRNILPQIAAEHSIQIRSIHGSDRIVIPYFVDGVEVGYKARRLDEDTEPKFFSTPNRKLYNLDSANIPADMGPIILTEGELDCLSVLQAGYARTVSMANGWSKDAEIKEQLDCIREHLKNEGQIIVAGDRDPVGETLPYAVYQHMWSIAPNPNVKYCVWPEGCKDANEVSVKYGDDVLRHCIENARQIDPPGGFICNGIDIPSKPSRKVLKTGTFLDDVAPFETRELSVLTGVPGCGKSHMALFACIHVAKQEKCRVGFMNLETDLKRLRKQAFKMITDGQSYEHLTPSGMDRFSKEIAWQKEHIRFAEYVEGETVKVERENGETVETEVELIGDWVMQYLWALIVNHKCKFIVIDPWNVINHKRPNGVTMTEYCNQMLQTIRKVADVGNVHICLLAHPAKMQDIKRAPNGYDIADSAAFFNKPGLGWTVHYYRQNGETQESYVTNWKIRNSDDVTNRKGEEIYKGTRIDLALDRHTQLYYENDLAQTGSNIY